MSRQVLYFVTVISIHNITTKPQYSNLTITTTLDVHNTVTCHLKAKRNSFQSLLFSVPVTSNQ